LVKNSLKDGIGAAECGTRFRGGFEKFAKDIQALRGGEADA
jgi:hypothetical protein